MIAIKQKEISFFILALLSFIFITSLSPVPVTATAVLSPSVTTSDQKIVNNTVYIDQVINEGPGWIAIHNATSLTSPTSQIIGYTHLDHGIHTAVPITISAAHTSVLVAMLHIDNGTFGVYDLGIDLPVRDSNNKIVEMGFNAESNFYPHIVVASQPVIGDQIVINLIELNESSGWVAIHNSTSQVGVFGATIGHALLHEGLNFNVAVTIDPNYVTDNLTAMIHFDTGDIGVWDYPINDHDMIDDGVPIIKEFGIGGVTVIESGSSSMFTLNSLISSPMVLHIIFSIISAFILVLVGTINFSRNASNRLNQLFLGFYTFIGLFQFFDALLMLLGTTVSKEISNFVRDIIISSLLLGLFFGILGVLLIYYGENLVLSMKAILVEAIFIIGLIAISLLNDSVSVSTEGTGYGSSGAHIQAFRTSIGWITISGFYTLALIIIIVVLVRLILDSQTGPDLRSKLIRLLIGLVLSISFLLLFDLSFAVQQIVDIVLNNYIIHFLVHTVIVIGALFILSAYITTLEEKGSS